MSGALAPRRQQHDGGAALRCFNERDKIESALAGQHDVEDDEVGGELRGSLLDHIAGVDPVHVEALRQQVVAQHSRQRRVIFRDQNPLFHTPLDENQPGQPSIRRNKLLDVARCFRAVNGTVRARGSSARRPDEEAPASPAPA